ncbi:MAG: TIGR00282 family metallophosphoesterase, partial [bacterium]
IRPANYPHGTPGYGYGIYRVGGVRLAVVNLLGRTFMEPLDDPFQKAKELVALLKEQTNCILVDIHAEATSEKAALAWMLDGQVSAVVGTHTHVMTADERILPKGTAFITDVGMVGPRDSVLGVKTDIVLQKFLTHMPAKFDLADGPVIINAVLIEIDDTSGKAGIITRLVEVID